ncbi:MAG TPA: SDR family NAD(P)-dependent oxidoreductase [Sphingorhabdus lacus]|uniref:SDR family NAD(P)-dependent oxidoreductase n=2 Tax=Sphingorhabdus lacus TaxID=392610 RepID=A0A6I6LC08_9SPHN|nr:SDR family NAD(P)-dependent oxidoreductase [Sphingorhabdus lacus]QGY82344.1 SDR family NAD(P)-dependent oxidoreductase [Sphingorhabdus lacus]HNW17877.1 SDR family NAD(P)-dependent oxidoreductase [Sphingorhabdus lacus]HPV68919.1 SDR family NAD(P)-dependent oxidoreductase [Sphingorhabdus lacus]
MRNLVGRLPMHIQGKTALVTGGTDGIGLEIARLLQRKGATVIVCSRREELLASARNEGFEAIQADLSNAAGCLDLVKALGERPLDILVNNAGMSGNFGPGEPLDLALTDRAFFLNLNAPIHLIGHLLPGLLARPEATIVNVTSGLAIAPRAGGPVYCASKAGLRSFTQALRYNLRESNVHVIEALPPVVDTAMTRGRLGGNKMSAPDCAAQIVDAIESNSAEANVGMVKLLKMVYSISPALARRVMIKF